MLLELDSLISSPWTIAIILNGVLVLIAWMIPQKLLTPGGLIHAFFLGVLIWGSLNWNGYAIVMFYFLVGSAVTKVGFAKKEAEGIAEKRSGARGPENVWGSALVGSLCAIASLFFPNYRDLLLLGYVASFSTKLSDTTASEIGKAYGEKTYLITTFKQVPKGTEGAISLEGTLAGLVASIIIALLSYLVGFIDPLGILWCVIAAFIATNIESVIGAVFQSNIPWLTNEIVNIFNTAIGAVVAMILQYVFKLI